MTDNTYECDHSELEYLGEQELLDGKSISLCNCLKCQSTVSLRIASMDQHSVINLPSYLHSERIHFK